jgi:hypothetical protein
MGDVPAFRPARWPHCGWREREPKETARLRRERRAYRTTNNYFTVEGDVVTNIIGNQNFGTQWAESITGIKGNVSTLMQNKETEDIGKALDALTEAIKGEPTLNDANRTAVLQQVNFLGKQATLPVDKREGGLIKPIIDTVSGMCAGVGGLAVAWATWGPVIFKFFGF